MEKFFRKKEITAILILILIVFLFYKNICKVYEPIKDILLTTEISISNVGEIITQINNVINEEFYKRDNFVNLFGYTQNVLNKDEENNFEVIKDKDGLLHYSYFANGPKDVSSYIEEMEELKNSISDKNVKLMYLMTPDKYIKGVTEFEYGMPYNYANESADNFLEGLDKNNIEYYDLRVNMLKWGIHGTDLFYKTDHHWRTETIFEAFSEFSKELSKKYNLNNLEYYTDKNNYEFVNYKNSFVGSMAKKAGIFYSGIDDYTLIYPKFDTNYNFYFKTGEIEHFSEGRFEETLISNELLRGEFDNGILEVDKYSSYLYGNQAEVHIENRNNPDGLKVVFIKDSFMVPFSAFFSSFCSDIYLLDPRYYNGNITNYINSLDNVDLVIVSFYPQDLSEEFFNFTK